MWRSGAPLIFVVAAACGSDHSPSERAADGTAACTACGPDEICVQRFDGQCLPSVPSVSCEPRNPACSGTNCSAACDLWHCKYGDPKGLYTCAAAPCGAELSDALSCYGP